MGGENRGLAVWWNGRLIGSAEAVFLPTERGLLYGDGLFETLAVADGRALEPERHFARLTASARTLGLPVPHAGLLARGLAECLAAAGPAAVLLRLTLSRGPGARGYAPASDDGPAQILVAAFAGRSDAAARARDGVSGTIVAGLAPGDLGRHKTLSALGYVAAALRARSAGYAEAVLVDDAGRVLETAGSNVFAVVAGRAITPPVSLPLLPGIGRARALASLGPEAGGERAFVAAELARADEAFLTNAVEGVVSLVSLDGIAIANGQPGPVTRALQEKHARWRAAAGQGGFQV